MSSQWGRKKVSSHSDPVTWGMVPGLQQSGAARQSAAPTLSLKTDIPLMIALVGLATVGLQVLQSANPLLEPAVKPRLEDDSLCGLTTGGQAECFFDCEVDKNDSNDRIHVEDLACLLDCFPDESDPGYCITSLLQDVIERGTCNVPGYNFCTNTSNTCQFSKDGGNIAITSGTCSDKTEQLWTNQNCTDTVLRQPAIIHTIAGNLYYRSCVTNYTFTNTGRMSDVNYSFSTQEQFSAKSQTNGIQPVRLAPISHVNLGRGLKTDLQFNHTRHRYPWICSLRTRGKRPEHLCTVTLLSVPPKPTVIVGVAHCTYICKERDRQGVDLPSCCCVSNVTYSCTKDRDRCGTNPRAVELDGEHAEIICGEWETGPTTKENSEEKYNVILPIKKIVRHEEFDASAEGPGGGSDIAVYLVDDTVLAERHRALRIYPGCLPPKGRARPKVAVHAGWSHPPPYSWLFKYVPGYTRHYKDFFKLWHYRMDVLPTCQDPKTYFVTNDELKFPSNTYYPAGTICAEEMARLSCFSAGESGSPLMAREETRPQRFYIEGLLSFLKGCDQLILHNYELSDHPEDENNYLLNYSDNPSVYTKLSCFLPWVAEQYGLHHDGDPEDEDCRVGRGEEVASQPCRETKVTRDGTEFECIFPFYYRNTLYTECFLYVEEEFAYPSYRCPVRNITTKRNGINDFQSFEFFELYQTNSEGELDPSLKCDCLTCRPCYLLFSTCKNDCPGVKSFGIIGGGSLLIAGSGAAALGFMGFGGFSALAGVGGTAMMGVMTARMMCTVPFCRARSRQCCLLTGTDSGPRCPRSC